MKYFLQNLKRIRNIRRTRIRSIVETTISDLLSRLIDFRDRASSDLDIGEILVILHEDIVFWAEMLDEIRLEDESLDFIGSEEDLDISDLIHHLSLRHREST